MTPDAWADVTGVVTAGGRSSRFGSDKALVTWQGRTLLRRGVLAEAPFSPGPISERAWSTGRAIGLVNLSLYPGRDEFRGLPEGKIGRAHV